MLSQKETHKENNEDVYEISIETTLIVNGQLCRHCASEYNRAISPKPHMWYDNEKLGVVIKICSIFLASFSFSHSLSSISLFSVSLPLVNRA